MNTKFDRFLHYFAACLRVIMLTALLLCGAGCPNPKALENLRNAGYKLGHQKGNLQALALMPLPGQEALRSVAMQFPGLSERPAANQEAFAEGFVEGFEAGYEAGKQQKLAEGVSPGAWRPRSLLE